MLDPKFVRENTDLVREALDRRRYPQHFLESFLKADSHWRTVSQELDHLKNERNRMTPKGKPTDDQLRALKQLADEIRNRQDAVNQAEEAVKNAALYLPNIPHESVAVGASEDENVEIKKVGMPRLFEFQPLAHDELATRRGLIDFEAATLIAGARFAVYRGNGARLERALINLMLDLHTQRHGYTELIPPVIVNTASLTGTGQLPKFEGDLFKIDDTDFWLSPTSEVQLTNSVRDRIIPEDQLPMKLTAHTACFRKEAGSYGKDMAGIIRQHQFNKIELVQLLTPDDAMAGLQALLGHAEAVLVALGLPYRVIQLCTGDLGFSSGITYDIEVWFPSQGKYREISSCSNFFDFQARRAMIRYREKTTGKVAYLHTLNGSGLAVGRTFAAILENFQNEDGSISVPSALVPYLNLEQL
ncbi:serine--tRNA ligase [bacterium]|nr:serine--tRNA ligase [bacterium]